MRITAIKCVSLVIAILSIVMTQTSFAKVPPYQSETIYDSRIKWEDESNKNKLLEMTPKWNNDFIKSVFAAFKNPEYKLSNTTDHHHTLQFVNAFWGPLDNPFNKNSRPAKIFLFFDDTARSSYNMALLVKNSADGNYYVFDKKQTNPTLLNDWVMNMRNLHLNSSSPVSISICNGYGNKPSDSCIEKSYQAETSDTLESEKAFLFTARSPMNSARRGLYEDWKTKVHHSKAFAVASNNIYNSSISWSNEPLRNELLNTVVSWQNFKTIQENFEKIRDIRYFNESTPHFLRRISWLYPDDGCWTRASAAIKDLFGPFNNVVNHFSRPSKVFVFGNLCANTTNSPDGYVSWWYHTAPIIKDASTNQTYVLDPSINSRTPLTMEKWVAEITSQTGACTNSAGNIEKFNICNGYGSGPFDSCESNFEDEIFNVLIQPHYQKEERERQIELDRDPQAVLGNQPPWLNSAQ